MYEALKGFCLVSAIFWSCLTIGLAIWGPQKEQTKQEAKSCGKETTEPIGRRIEESRRSKDKGLTYPGPWNRTARH